MEDLLISILGIFGYPVNLQGSLSSDEEYPKHFFTFWNDSTQGGSAYDNKEYEVQWEYSVNFYSVDPIAVNEKLKEAKVLLINAGFEVNGVGHSVGSDEASHTGRGITVFYHERKE